MTSQGSLDPTRRDTWLRQIAAARYWCPKTGGKSREGFPVIYPGFIYKPDGSIVAARSNGFFREIELAPVVVTETQVSIECTAALIAHEAGHGVFDSLQESRQEMARYWRDMMRRYPSHVPRPLPWSETREEDHVALQINQCFNCPDILGLAITWSGRL